MLATLQREIEHQKIDDTLHPGMLHLICALIENDGLTVSELASRLSMAKSTVTGAVHRMESAGLVELVPDPTDLRLRRVRLTKQGHSLRPACAKIDEAISQQLEEAFSENERKQIFKLLGRLVTTMAAGVE